MTAMESIRRQLKEADITKIFFTDLNGRVMSLPVNPRDIESIMASGIGFDGSSVAGYARVENSDRILCPDPSSFRLVRFADERLGFFIGHIYNQKGDRAQADPRAVLEHCVRRAEAEHGYRFMIGPEHEYFILAEDGNGDLLHSDDAGYFLSAPHDKGETVRNRILSILKSCGVDFEKAHHEVTPSQHEINLKPADPLGAADRTVLFNHVTQKAAADCGYHASFMPKPFDGFNRSAFHIHLSLTDLEGRNLFYDEADPQHLSRLARQFIGGILKYARETSIIMASTFNSYKAYVLEREAPVMRSWGVMNRSSMVRIPYTANPAGTRLELRNPDPAGNVYLQIAVLIAMGLQGIADGLDCGRPEWRSTNKVDMNARLWDRRFLPKSMFEALVEAERSRFLKTVLGERIYTNYMTLKKKDWEEHRTHVTPRELDKYLLG